MKSNIPLQKQIYATVLVPIALIFNLIFSSLNIIKGDEIIYKMILVLIGAFLLIVYFPAYEGRIFLLITILIVPCVLTNGYEGITLILRMIADFGISAALYVFLLVHKKVPFLKSIVLFPLIYFSIPAMSGVSVYYFAENYISGSKNQIGIICMFCTILWFSIKDLKDEKNDLLDGLVVFMYVFCTYWVQSRGGIIACLVFLVAYFGKLYNDGTQLQRYIMRALLLELGIILTFTWTEWEYSIESIAHLVFNVFEAKGVTDSSRLIIWSNYFQSLDILHLLLGGVSRTVAMGRVYSLHNTFLIMHSRMGIVSVGVFLIFAVVLTKGMKDARTRFRSLMLLVVLIRGFTDAVAFSFFDLVILLLLISLSADLRGSRNVSKGLQSTFDVA